MRPTGYNRGCHPERPPPCHCSIIIAHRSRRGVIGSRFTLPGSGRSQTPSTDGCCPEGYFAEEHTHFGARVEIDVATFQDEPSGGGGAATLAARPRVWSPPEPTAVLPAEFPDAIGVQVYEAEGGARLVAAIG